MVLGKFDWILSSTPTDPLLLFFTIYVWMDGLWCYPFALFLIFLWLFGSWNVKKGKGIKVLFIELILSNFQLSPMRESTVKKRKSEVNFINQKDTDFILIITSWKKNDTSSLFLNFLRLSNQWIHIALRLSNANVCYVWHSLMMIRVMLVSLFWLATN